MVLGQFSESVIGFQQLPQLLRELARHQPLAGQSEGSGRGQPRRDGDQMVRIGTAQGVGHPAQPQAGVRHHDRRADAPAGIDRRSQVQPRTDQ